MGACICKDKLCGIIQINKKYDINLDEQENEISEKNKLKIVIIETETLEEKDLNNEIEKKESEKIENEKKFEENKIIIKDLYEDVKSQEIYIQNLKTYINDLNFDFNEINNQMNISVDSLDDIKENINQNNKNNFINKIKIILDKIDKFNEIIEKIKNNEIKKIENNYKKIQSNLNEIEKKKEKNDIDSYRTSLKMNNNIIQIKLKEFKSIIENLIKGKKSYEEIKKEIEKEKEQLQNEIKEYSEKAEIFQKTIISSSRNEKNIGPKIDKEFLKGSMLLGIQDNKNPKEIFNSKLLFKEDNNIIYQKQELLRKNWKEICFVYEEYDIHDVNYEIKAVGLPENLFYNKIIEGFYPDTLVEIIEFQIDGNNAKYNYKDFRLEFDIHLRNLESNKIHLKYKESKLKLTQEDKRVRKFFRNDCYGISKNLKGQVGKFTLVLKCEFEIINFKDEIFIKTKEGEYECGGVVPPEGKRTFVRMSKKIGNISFKYTISIESIDKKPLKKTNLIVPLCFEGGNNIIKKKNLSCNNKSDNNVEYKKDKKVYEIKFIDTDKSYGEFVIEGQLENKCKGKWNCDFNDKEIEEQLSEEYKKDKERFKEISMKIINEYDEKHKNDLIKVTDFVKIGKWINQNIKYDINFHGKNEITAIEIYNNRAGVCHHFTKLYNALMFSLGYQCIYVSGYATSKIIFNKDDGHAWSLIKVNENWLPFDSTWGIFSGKLPVSHLFISYFNRGTKACGSDKINIIGTQLEGHFLE